MAFQKGHVPTNKGQKKAGAPAEVTATVLKAMPVGQTGAVAIKVERSGNRVRLRNIGHALEGCISTEKGDERYRLEPNKWTRVSDAVYDQLRGKFYEPKVTEVPDWEIGGENDAAKRTYRQEANQEYNIEFPDEAPRD